LSYAKYIFYTSFKITRKFEGQRHRGCVIPLLNGNDGLPTHPDSFRKFFLRNRCGLAKLLDPVDDLVCHIGIIQARSNTSNKLYIYLKNSFRIFITSSWKPQARTAPPMPGLKNPAEACSSRVAERTIASSAGVARTLRPSRKAWLMRPSSPGFQAFHCPWMCCRPRITRSSGACTDAPGACRSITSTGEPNRKWRSCRTATAATAGGGSSTAPASAASARRRLNGKVSELILKNYITGEFSDSLMMPSQGRLAAKEILLFGMGRTSQLNEERFEQIFPLLIQKIVKLKSNDMALSLGDFAKDFMGWRTLLRSFMGTLVLQHGRDDYRVLCAENTKWVQEAKRRNMDFGPEVTVSYV